MEHLTESKSELEHNWITEITFSQMNSVKIISISCMQTEMGLVKCGTEMVLLAVSSDGYNWHRQRLCSGSPSSQTLLCLITVFYIIPSPLRLCPVKYAYGTYFLDGSWWSRYKNYLYPLSTRKWDQYFCSSCNGTSLQEQLAKSRRQKSPFSSLLCYMVISQHTARKTLLVSSFPRLLQLDSPR